MIELQIGRLRIIARPAYALPDRPCLVGVRIDGIDFGGTILTHKMQAGHHELWPWLRLPGDLKLRSRNPRKRMAKRIRIIHVINSFTHGGAEAMLSNLLLRTDRQRFDPSVALLIDDQTLAGPVIASGIPVTVVGMRAGVPDPRGIFRLARLLRQERPHVVQTWMDHSNLIGGLAAWLTGRTRLIWGVHHSNHVVGLSKRSTLLTVSACAKLSSRVPAKIVYCSEVARRLYQSRGFAADRSLVIPNGFDTGRFCPDPAARVDVRRELGVSQDAMLVGLAARFDPVKDHPNFLAAAAIVAERMPEVHFVLCGDKVDANNATLMSRVSEPDLLGRCHLLGARQDIARIHAAMDVATCSSISEAFPLAVGESMSCGVPCVATDVGDSSLMIGSTGTTVPARNSPALAEAILQMLYMTSAERTALGLRARERVRDLFDLQVIVDRYAQLYCDLAQSDAVVSGNDSSAVEERTMFSLGPSPLPNEVKCK